MATVREALDIAISNRKAINAMTNGAKKINQVDDVQTLTNDDLILVFDNQGNITGKTTVQNLISLFGIVTQFIEVNGVQFRLLKKEGNNIINGIELNDVISSGYIQDGSTEVLFIRGKYVNTLNDGDVLNIGTLANKFTDGNYANVRYAKLS